MIGYDTTANNTAKPLIISKGSKKILQKACQTSLDNEARKVLRPRIQDHEPLNLSPLCPANHQNLTHSPPINLQNAESYDLKIALLS